MSNRDRWNRNLALARHRRATVTVLFATTCVPLMMMVGLAIDYSFYSESQAQLDMAADTASLHAVRAAATATSNGMDYKVAGVAAAQQWFAAQVTPLVGITITGGYEPLPAADITITYDGSTGTYTAQVSYSGQVATHFGGLFKIFSWRIAGSATSSIGNSFVEVDMLLDNSSSMLLPTTAADIKTLEAAEMCSTQAVNSGHPIMDGGSYMWTFTGTYGYGSGYTVPPMSVNGSCTSAYDGDPTECFYPPSQLSTTAQVYGTCAHPINTSLGYGGYPAAPCAFACHNDPTGGNNDYYGLAKSLGISLRFGVVQSAAAAIIQQLQAAQNSSGVPNQFSVGVYDFWAEPRNNSNQAMAAFGEGTGFQSVYPGPNAGEAGTNLSSAATATQAIATPFYSSTTYAGVNRNASDTNIPAALSMLGGIITSAGSGGTAATPRKNLFIVTDGMEDIASPAYQGAMDPTLCQQFKSLGVQVYVLYTPYLPVPNSQYLNVDKSAAESSSGGTPPIIAALTACASSPANFYQASTTADINAAMQSMLNAAINSPGRLTN